jgi:hypothetical protein
LTLHKDSIQFEIGQDGWTAPSQVQPDEKGKLPERRVLFRPFTGVAPRMYRRSFEKDRELKNKNTGALEIQDPDWGTPYDLSTKSYAELETALTKDVAI